jgi:hypothetical protein
MKHLVSPSGLLSVFVLGACAASPDARALFASEERLEVGAVPAAARGECRLDDDGVFYVLGEDPQHPRVRYRDGQLSLNESCAIRAGSKLGRKIPPVYVNGRPIGFC